MGDTIATEPEVTGSKSQTQDVADRSTTGESTTRTAPAVKQTPDAKKKAFKPTEHIVELRVAIYNSKSQVLEGARRTLSPVKGKNGQTNWGTDPDIMKKLEFATDEYLQDFNMVLSHKTMKFDVNKAEELFKLNYLRTQPDVANSAKDITDKTSHVIWDEVTEAAQSNKSFDKVFTAYGYIKDMSEAEKAKFCRLFSVNTYRISPDLIMKKLREHADADPEAFCEMFENKNKAHKMFLLELVEHRVIKRDKLAFFFGELILGATEALAIEYIKDPANQDMKIALIRALDLAKR